MTTAEVPTRQDETRGMNLIRLEWVRRRLPQRDEIDALCAAVAAADELAEPVLVDPRFGVWLDRLIRLLDRRAPDLLPDGDFHATCVQAWMFTAAVRCLHPSARGESTDVRVDAHGIVPLPGTGLRVVFPRSYAGVMVRMCADPPGLSVDLPFGIAVVHADSDVIEDIVPAEPLAEVAPMPVIAPSDLSWMRRWTAAGGRLRSERTRSEWMPGLRTQLRPVLTELGCPDGILINRLPDLKQRTDPSIDHLSLLYVRDRARYDSVVAQLDAAPDGDIRKVLLGHRAYVERDMSTAAAIYAELIARHPDDVDLWRDFTFAMRHLGDPVPGETWLFHADEVIARAAACVPDPAPLSRFVPVDDMPPASQFALGLLEWVRDDFDRR